MGVVIHFEGQLKSESDFLQVIIIARDFADKYNLHTERIDIPEKTLIRVAGEDEWKYQGPVKGIKLIINEWAEPLWVAFDENLYMQEFCKTQFADISTHLLVVDLLRAIEPNFSNFEVFDEGEFWETSDVRLLEERREAFFEALNEAQQKNPLLQAGPFKTESGRIIDAIQ